MSRWLVTGAAGMLGSDLVDRIRATGQWVVGYDHAALDVTDAEAIRAALDDAAPDVVINAAAYTRVDDAESDEESALDINGRAPGTLAIECAARARLIHVSTDYVFAGEADAPYEVDAPVAPRSAYGRSKAQGEAAVMALARGGADVHVVRTGWLYGVRGGSFVRAIGGRLARGESVDVVTDQRGAPTWTVDLAERLVALGSADVGPGIWHCSAAGDATWFDVAVALAELLGVPADRVRPTTSAAFVRPAPRPAYSVLSNRKWVEAGLPAMPHWRDALATAMTSGGDALIS
jgi:dTDP-4-dehydrorhamnose reductase